MRLTEEMLAEVVSEVAGNLKTPWKEGTIDWTPPYHRRTMRVAAERREAAEGYPRGASPMRQLEGRLSP